METKSLALGLILGLLIFGAGRKKSELVLLETSPVTTEKTLDVYALNDSLDLAWKRIKRFEVSTPNPDWLELKLNAIQPANIEINLSGSSIFDWESFELKGNAILFLDHLGAVLAEDLNLKVKISVRNQVGESSALPFADWNLAFQRGKMVAENLHRRWKIEPERMTFNQLQSPSKLVELSIRIESKN